MIKPSECPICREDAEEKVFFMRNGKERVIRCKNLFRDDHINDNIGMISSSTRLGAILRWNWWCFWERMRRKAK